MRTPLAWLAGWLTLSFVVVTNWPEHRLIVSGFWVGWAMAIWGQDLADWMRSPRTIRRAEKIGIWLVRTRLIRRFSVGSLFMKHNRGA